MNTLYHNYFISNFFEPSRLVWRDKSKSKPKPKAIATSPGSEAMVSKKPISTKEALESADRADLILNKRIISSIGKSDSIIKNEKQFQTLVDKLAARGHALTKSKKKIRDEYFNLIGKAHTNWDINKNKDKTKKGEVAGVKEVKITAEKIKERKVKIRQELYTELSKIKNRKKLQEEVNNLAAEYNAKIKESKDPVEKEAYKGMIAEANGYILDRAKERILIPTKLAEEVKNKLTKETVSTFLSGIEDKNYAQKRAEFKSVVASDVKGGAMLLTMAMQKALGFKGGNIDGKIGKKTIKKLANISGAKVESRAKVAQNDKIKVLKKSIDYSKMSSHELAQLDDKNVPQDQKDHIIIKQAIKQKNLDEGKVYKWLYT